MLLVVGCRRAILDRTRRAGSELDRQAQAASSRGRGGAHAPPARPALRGSTGSWRNDTAAVVSRAVRSPTGRRGRVAHLSVSAVLVSSRGVAPERLGARACESPAFYLELGSVVRSMQALAYRGYSGTVIRYDWPQGQWRAW